METLKGRRILITGAGGFVGKYVIDALFAAGYGPEELCCLVQDQDRQTPMRTTTYSADISDRDQIFNLVKQVNPSAVIHLAAVALPADAKRNSLRAWRTNVDGTIALADAILSYAPQARLIFAGSAEAYGESFNDQELPVVEDAALQPFTAYGASKAAAEIAVMQRVREGLDAICFRAFNHTGPGQPADYVIPSFAKQIAAIESDRTNCSLKVGNLDAFRDFLDVRDVAQAYVRAIEADVAPNGKRVFNISSGTARRIGNILDLLISKSHVDIKIEVDPERLRPSEVEVAVGDNTRAKHLLGWQPLISFDETLQAVIEFWRKRV